MDNNNNTVIELKPCIFNAENLCFGSDKEKLGKLLKGCTTVLCLPILSTCLEEYANQFIKFKKDGVSKVYQGFLEFILFVLNSQDNPNSSQEYIII
jgi:hypothetical protein